MQSDAGQQEPSAVHINCYLVRGAGRTILIDAGAEASSNGVGS
jgi:hypothetical protein